MMDGELEALLGIFRARRPRLTRRHNLITTGFCLIDEVQLCKLGSDRAICNAFF